MLEFHLCWSIGMSFWGKYGVQNLFTVDQSNWEGHLNKIIWHGPPWSILVKPFCLKESLSIFLLQLQLKRVGGEQTHNFPGGRWWPMPLEPYYLYFVFYFIVKVRSQIMWPFFLNYNIILIWCLYWNDYTWLCLNI